MLASHGRCRARLKQAARLSFLWRMHIRAETPVSFRYYSRCCGCCFIQRFSPSKAVRLAWSRIAGGIKSRVGQHSARDPCGHVARRDALSAAGRDRRGGFGDRAGRLASRAARCEPKTMRSSWCMKPSIAASTSSTTRGTTTTAAARCAWARRWQQGGYRQKVFLMTKIDGRTKEAAASQIDESLKRLQVDHLDLLQHHEVIRFDDPDRIFTEGGAMEAVLGGEAGGQGPLHRVHGPQGPAHSPLHAGGGGPTRLPFRHRADADQHHGRALPQLRAAGGAAGDQAATSRCSA